MRSPLAVVTVTAALLALVLPSGCAQPAKACSASTCSGCCSDTNECLPGNSPRACGAGAVACTACGVLQTCQFGFCGVYSNGGGSGGASGGGTGGGSGGGSSGGGVGGSGGGASACPGTCAGCCTAGGQCVAPANTSAACGSAGSACQSCSASQSCTAGACVNPSCSGCVDASNACVAGTSNGACGRNGVTCTQCVNGATCNGADCTGGTCSGCFDAAQVCQPGNTTGACGANGQSCAVCPGGWACSAGSCTAGAGGGAGGGGTGGGAGGGAGGGGTGGGGTGGGSACVTTLTGVVLAPTDPAAGYGNPVPLPGALVYVPSGTVQPFGAGTACGHCTPPAAVTSTTSAFDGTFSLPNVPCGTAVPVVLELGRWRRQLTLVISGGALALTASQTRFPRRQGEGHPNDTIPLMAMVTGSGDVIECVLPKIGIASTEFSLPTGTGRVRFYQDNGATFAGGAPAASTLFGSPSELAKYDLVILDCTANQVIRTAAERANVEAWVNSGGRLFASHFNYVWLFGQPTPSSLTPTATWVPQQANPANQDALIDVSFPRGARFGQWVYQVGAQATTSTPAAPRIAITDVRHDADAVLPPAQQWVSGTTGTANVPLLFSFETPVGAAQQCGRVFFNDFHVASTAFSAATVWPGECSGLTGMTAQEKVFEYLLFDLAACVGP